MIPPGGSQSLFGIGDSRPSPWSQLPAAWFSLALSQNWAVGEYGTFINEMQFWPPSALFLSARILGEEKNGKQSETNSYFFNQL